MSFLFGIIAFAGLASLVIRHAVRAGQEQRRQAAETAAQLGLEFRSGNLDLQAQLQRAQGGAELSAEQLQALKSQKWLHALAGAMSPWSMQGRYQGVQVALREVYRGSGKHRQRLLRLEACFEKPLSFQVAVGKENVIHKLGKAAGLLEDIRSGDDEFDREFLVKGSPEQSVRMWLANPGHREALRDLFSRLPAATVTEASIAVEDPDRRLDGDSCRSRLEALTAAARQLRG